MKKTLVTVVLFVFCTAGFSQFQSKRKFIYGTLSGQQTHTGYFWFDNQLTQMGQRILFKETPNSKQQKTLYAYEFNTFSSDSIFLRTFKTIPYGLMRLDAMIPRIVSGKFELYNAIYANPYVSKTSDHFYLYDGSEKIRLIRKKFKEQMKELLASDEEIIQRIELEELDYDDLPTIIHNYNLRQQNKNTKVTRVE